MLKKALLLLSPLVLAGCSLVGDRSSYEEPPYQVVERMGGQVEVRRYGPRLVADVTMTAAESDQSGNSAFRVLFRYISGENKARGKVSMTVPVEQGAAGDAMRMRFFFPNSYTMATAPEPLDPRIAIAEVPGQTVMVRRYSGFNGQAAKAEETAALDAVLAKSAYAPVGPPVFLSYDPPWTLPPFRRHEVAREVVAR